MTVEITGSGKTLYVNPDHIVRLEATQNGTTIYLVGGHSEGIPLMIAASVLSQLKGGVPTLRDLINAVSA